MFQLGTLVAGGLCLQVGFCKSEKMGVGTCVSVCPFDSHPCCRELCLQFAHNNQWLKHQAALEPRVDTKSVHLCLLSARQALEPVY